jgi:hypothetical protein
VHPFLCTNRVDKKRYNRQQEESCFVLRYWCSNTKKWDNKFASFFAITKNYEHKKAPVVDATFLNIEKNILSFAGAFAAFAAS